VLNQRNTSTRHKLEVPSIAIVTLRGYRLLLVGREHGIAERGAMIDHVF
jgi:hypothetical protein